MIFVFGLIGKNNYEKNDAVVLKSTDSKFEPREGGTTHYRLREGMKIKIIKQEDDWIKIKRNDGKLGWVQKSTLEKI